MKTGETLHLYEQVTLLALRDRKGTMATSFAGQLVAGAVLAELIMDGRIDADGAESRSVSVAMTKATGDAILDEALTTLRSARKPASLEHWVMKLGSRQKLLQRVCDQLCERRILREDRRTVLLFFTRRSYPEMNPAPEREIIDRIRGAVLDEAAEVRKETAVLIALADGADLLGEIFEPEEVERHRSRIRELTEGQQVGEATRAAIEACRMAIMVATTLPATTSVIT